VKFPQNALKKKPAMIAGHDFAKLLRQMSEPHRTMVSLVAATGLRIGELLLTKVLQPAAKVAGLGRVTWHRFRHIHSSLLNDINVPLKIAQEQLGRASIATTLNIYTHVDASHRKAIEAVERELFVVLDHTGLQTAAALEKCSAGK
jgi:integrase